MAYSSHRCSSDMGRARRMMRPTQARSQDFFFWGGGGGGGGGGVRSLERKGYFCQRFSVAVKSIYNQLRHDNSLLL